MYWTNFAKDYMLDGLSESETHGAKYASLHTAFSVSGANEVTGGTPAYARQPVSWVASDAGIKGTYFPLTFDVPTSTIAWVGFWDAVSGGNFLAMAPSNGSAIVPASSETGTDLSNNDVVVKGHGFSAGTRVVFWGVFPTGVTLGTQYFVIATGLATDSFRVSATSGGAAINISGIPPVNYFVQKCVPATYVGQSQHILATGAMSIGLIA